ncbi:hypothetical protein O6P43_010594 [Quillaja saponaria]|uniref:Uncharacterized protein n=1 Tax=Quillaja saponaria TaxID=32244 RepID=A0AAD7Q0S9_QUISA|nr:hypothetical protein O6P43_010594 [Quillaja saponaria]
MASCATIMPETGELPEDNPERQQSSRGVIDEHYLKLGRSGVQSMPNSLPYHLNRVSGLHPKPLLRSVPGNDPEERGSRNTQVSQETLFRR